MADRSTITQVVQFGMETPAQAGANATLVAATKKMQTLDITMDPKFSVDEFQPSGYKFSTVVATEREWLEATMKGQPTYTEILYPLASIINSTTPATLLDGGLDHTARKWTFSPSTSGPDVIQTYTIEQGSSTRAQRVGNAVFTEFNFKFTREKVEMGGKLLGTKISDNFTLTAALPSPPLIPILASQISVYLDTTSAGLGTTKLLRLFSGELALTGRFGAVWPVDAAQASYAGLVETDPKLTFKALVEADAQGMALLTALRANTQQFLRIECAGGLIPTDATNSYRFRIDMAVQVTSPNAFADEKGVYAIPFDFTVVHDATWGKAITIDVQNAQATL